MSVARCPSTAELESFVAGRLHGSESETVETHVENCPTCCATMRSLGASDPFVDLLKAGASRSGDFVGEEAEQIAARAAERWASEAGGPEHVQAANAAADERTENLRPAKPHERELVPVAAGAAQEGRFPEILGEYRLGRILGEGGMGAVVEATHRRLGRAVAIKLLHTDRVRDPSAAERFEREMKSVGSVIHPHIVQALDAGEAEGLLYLAMERLDGVTVGRLAEVLGTLEVADACEIVRQAALGVAAAHRAKMVHRDVKPANLMLARLEPREEDPTSDFPVAVKLLDLGLARFQEEANDAGLTEQGAVMGTIDYMAPEQALSSHEADPPADVYSLGGTLYRLLAGCPPYGDHPKRPLMQKLSHLLAQEPPSLRTLRPDLPEPLLALVDRLLDRNPANRPSASDLARELAPLAAGASLPALLRVAEAAPPGVGPLRSRSTLGTQALGDTAARLAGDVSGFATSPALAAPAAGRGGSRTRTWVALACAGFAVAALVAAFVFRILTDRGTLVVEIADPAVEAKVTQEGLRIVDTKSGREYLLKPKGNASEADRSFPQASGAYRADAPQGLRLEITDDAGLRVESEEFRLTRGDVLRVRVFAEAPKPESPPAEAVAALVPADPPPTAPVVPPGPPSAAPPTPVVEEKIDAVQSAALAEKYDREIAQATEALAAGSADRTETLLARASAHAGKGDWPNALADFEAALKRDPLNARPRFLRGLVREKSGDAAGAAEDFAAAAEIDPAIVDDPPRLPPLGLFGNRLVAAWLNEVGARGTYFAPDGAAVEFGSERPIDGEVNRFDIVYAMKPDEGPVDDEAAEILRQASAVRILTLSGPLSDAGFARLASSPWASSLKEAVIDAPRVGDAGWSELKRFEGLNWLSLHDRTSPAIAPHIGELRALTKLVISAAGSPQGAYETLTLPPTVSDLCLYSCSMTPAHFREIVADLPLTGMELRYAYNDVGYLEALADIPTLRYLSIWGCPQLGDAGAERLARMPQLIWLGYRACGATDAGVEKLATLPNLRSLSIEESTLSEAAIERFRLARAECTVNSDLGQLPSYAESRSLPEPMVEEQPPVESFVNSLGMTMRRIPAGEFLIGSRDEQIAKIASLDLDTKLPETRDELPQHAERISEPFLLATHETTNAQFAKFVEAESYVTLAERDGDQLTWRSPGFPREEDVPVACVSWFDAVAFTNWLSRVEGRPYRLPTEPEWEYACRAGSDTLYSFGDDPKGLAKVANMRGGEDRFEFAAPVGSFEPNAFGLFDMHGNAGEWCIDVYDPFAYGRAEGESSPLVPGAPRNTRGGTWKSATWDLRSTKRYGAGPGDRYANLGFRVAIPLRAADDGK